MKNKNTTISAIFLRNMVIVVLVSIGLWSLIWMHGEYSAFKVESKALREEHIASQKDILRSHVANVAIYIEYMKNQTEERLKNSIRERVYEALQITESIYQQNRTSKSLDEIKILIKDTLSPIRFNNGRGYFFAVSMDGVEQLYPIRPELEGKNLMNLQDSHGNFVIRDEINIIKKSGEGFVTDFWPKPDKDPGVAYPKISFVKYFKPLDWYFGTGEYLDDVKVQIQEEVLNYLKDIRFDEEGYFFASTYHGDPLFSNGHITKGTKSILDLIDPNGVKIFQEYQKAVENPDGGFVYYLWHKLESPAPSPKLSFVKGIPDWEWIIGAGSYLDTIDETILKNKAALKDDLRNNSLKSMLILLFLFLLCLFWARHVSTKIQAGITSFSSFFKKAATDSARIDPDDLHFFEFAEIAILANKMLADRTQAEAALRESEKKYRLLTDNITDTIWEMDIDTLRFNYVSPSATSNTGYSADEIASRQLNDLLTPDSMEFVASVMGEELIADKSGLAKPRTMELEFYHKDGSTVWAEVSARFARDMKGCPYAIVGVTRDITERRKVENALKESEKKLRTIIEHSNELFYIHDTKNILTYASPTSKNILGYTPDEMMIKWTELATDNPINLKGIEITEKTIKTKKKQKPYLLELEKKDGTFIFLEIDESPVKNADGEVIAIAGAGRDVTESILAQRHIEELQSEIIQARKMESIGTLSGGIAHDFNNILSIILGNAELALDDVPESNSAHFNLEEIKSAGMRAKNIVSQLLAFSRKTDQHLKPTAIVPVIKDALAFLRSTIPTTIDIHADFSDAGETVLADPVGLNQVMMNLCINASHAMEQTGGVLAVNVESVSIENNEAGGGPDLLSGDYVKITVSDTGTGIDPDIADRIFDPYFTTKGVGKGSGMGLAVVHGIVKNHGGLISVDSAPGKGAVFSILLPKIAEQPEIKTATPMDLPTGSETILFVDDEESIMKLGQRMMERLGYTVDATMSPADALERFCLSPDKYDLVITDMTMPQMTGVVLAEKLMRIRGDIPIIICSGYSALIDEEKAKTIDIAAFVMKPISRQKIANIIRQVLDQ